ncbi:hypothetical protein RE9416_16970 [Prescottella equi]|nr:hypothetical protein RE9416_16970 [Prescottella equi]
MTKPVAALLELLEDGPGGDELRYAHLIGQVAAEVIASSPVRTDIKRVTAEIQLHQIDSNALRPSYATLLGLFQTLLAQTYVEPKKLDQGPVKERILVALAAAPAGSTELAKKIGCASAVASRGLRTLREQNLVRRLTAESPADRRYHLHELTEDGEQFVDRRVAGDQTVLSDDLEEGQTTAPPTIHGDDELRQIIKLTRHINRHDPKRAVDIAGTLERLKDQAVEPRLRAEAIGELSVMTRGVNNLFGRHDLERWYNELLDMADVDPSIAARAYYERARWRMMYEPPAGDVDGGLRDLERARQIAQTLNGNEKNYRLAWCLYQEAIVSLHRGDPSQTVTKIQKAKNYFDLIDDEGLEPIQGALASDVILARALYEQGQTALAVRELKTVAATAKASSYPRQVADAQLWLGRWEAASGANDTDYLSAAVRSYEELGNPDLAVEAKSIDSARRYFASDRSALFTSVLKSELNDYTRQLSREGAENDPPAISWRRALLLRKVGVVSCLENSEGEADDAFLQSLNTYLTTKNQRGASETIAQWWLCRRGTKPTTHSDLSDFIVEFGGKHVQDDVLDAVIERVDETRSAEQLLLDGESLPLLLRSALLS